MTLRLISWNTASRSNRAKAQLDFLRQRKPDIVAFQEVSPTSARFFRRLIPEILNLPIVRWSLDGEAPPGSRKRSLGVLIASRFPVASSASTRIQSPWAEKAISLSLRVPWGPIDVHTVHVPPGASNGWVKVEVLESVYLALCVPCGRPTILTGDFNTPMAELPSGEMISWAQRIARNGRPVLRRSKAGGNAERWDSAERNILQGLPRCGLRDAFRSKVGFEVEEWSWVHKRQGIETPRRFDHAFVSDDIHVAGISYLHSARESGLSDHSALELEFRAAL